MTIISEYQTHAKLGLHEHCSVTIKKSKGYGTPVQKCGSTGTHGRTIYPSPIKSHLHAWSLSPEFRRDYALCLFLVVCNGLVNSAGGLPAWRIWNKCTYGIFKPLRPIHPRCPQQTGSTAFGLEHPRQVGYTKVDLGVVGVRMRNQLSTFVQEMMLWAGKILVCRLRHFGLRTVWIHHW